MANANVKPMTNEEMQRKILEVELQTKMILLKKTEQDNNAFEEIEDRRHKQNKQRQAEMRQSILNRIARQRQCRHMAGGKPGNILKGGGIGSFSILTQAMMPDGVTILIQCARCRLKRVPPSQALKKADPKAYVAELEEYNALLEDSNDNGLSPLRGPTFMFTNEQGVPFRPAFEPGVSVGK